MNFICKKYYYVDIVINGNPIRKGKYTKVLYPVTHEWLDYEHNPVTDPAEIARLEAAATPENEVAETFDEHADFMEKIVDLDGISDLPTHSHTILAVWRPSGLQEFISMEYDNLVPGDTYLIYIKNMADHQETVYLPSYDGLHLHAGADQISIPAGEIRAVRFLSMGDRGVWEIIPEPVNSQSIVSIADSDFLVFRYIWDSSAGTDLDSATEVVNSNIPNVDNKAVGYGCPGNAVPAVTNILKWAGDNTSSGEECVYISIKDLRENHLDVLPEVTKFMAYATWFGSKGTGNASFSLIAYKGGTMSQDGYNFVNTGGQVIYSKIHTFEVNTTKGIPDYKDNYTKVTDISYNKITNTVSMAVGDTVIDNQNSLEELYKMFDNYLAKDNAKVYEPTGDYNPATKKYVDDNSRSAVFLFNLDREGNITTLPGTYAGMTKAINDEKNIIVKLVNAGGVEYYLKPVKYDYDISYISLTFNSNIRFYYDPNIELSRFVLNLSSNDVITGKEEVHLISETCLIKTNQEEYIPTDEYNPATKKYVDEASSSLVIEITKTVEEEPDGSTLTSYTVPAGTYDKIKDAVLNNKEILVAILEGYPQQYNIIKPVKVQLDERINVITIYDSFTIFHDSPGASLMQDSFKLNRSDNIMRYPLNVLKENYYAEITILDTLIPSRSVSDLQCRIDTGTFEEMLDAYRNRMPIHLGITLPNGYFYIDSSVSYGVTEVDNDVVALSFSLSDNTADSIESTFITVSKNNKASCRMYSYSFLPIGGIYEFNPTSEFDPATKKYVDDAVTPLEKANVTYKEEAIIEPVTNDTFLDLYSYGVEWDITVADPHLTRIGNPLLHKSLPIQSAYRGCVVNGNKVNYYLNPNNWAFKEDGVTPSVLDGTDGTVRVHTPKFYGRSWEDGNKRRVRISLVKIDDTWQEIPEMFVDAYKSTLDATVPSTTKAVSVVNTTTTFRGGSGRSDYDVYLDTDPFRTDLGKPRTNVRRSVMRTYANNANSELLCYEYYKWIFYWAYVIEYANFNSQEAYNADLTSDGYKQGGLGDGVTTMNITHWSEYNGIYPLTPCGFGNDIGNFTGVKTYEVAATENYTAHKMDMPRWRGFDNPFGDVWINLEGVIIQGYTEEDDTTFDWNNVYTTTDPAKFGDTEDYKNQMTIAGRQLFERGYTKAFDLGDKANIIPTTIGGSGTTFMCDYSQIGSKNASLKTLFVGGDVRDNASAGIGSFNSYNVIDISSGLVGFRTLTKA